MTRQPAIFLDRDGTIIEDAGYIRDPHDLIYHPWTFRALTMLQQKYQLIIVSNQSGIAKGITTETEVRDVNRHMLETLEDNGIRILAVYFCPHATEDNCACKKPKPYFLLKAAEEFGIDLPCSFIIGDHPSDVLCGINAGVTPLYVLTGHGEKHREELPPGIRICKNLLVAAHCILNNGST